MIRTLSISLGCPKNRVDTERTLGFLGQIAPVESAHEADLVFINTCGFIASAVEESVRVILEHVRDINELPEETRPLLVVAGCLVGRYGKETLSPDLPEIDLLLDASNVAGWRGQLQALLVKRASAHTGGGAKESVASLMTHTPVPRILSTGPSYAWLKISEGCQHACSFCTIPSIRGGLVSLPAEGLIEEASFLVGQGVKELILVAQDVTAWGKDTGHSLQQLLEPLLKLDSLEWLRLMYLYPAGLTDELLGFLQQAGKPFLPYFDVPVQHASASVLSRMGRPFATDPRKVIDRVRHYFPLASLRTSIIAGFPGETEEDFAMLCDFVQEVRFHHLGVFAYEAEEGTPAASMPGQISDPVKQWRRDYLMNLQGEISEEILEEYVGSQQSVLVDAPHGEWPGLYTGRVWFQAPDIDGVTYVSGPGVEAGSMVIADITESSTYDLVGLS